MGRRGLTCVQPPNIDNINIIDKETIIMGGYLCEKTSCKHCEKTHCGEGGLCVENRCECTKYTPSTHYSEFC